MSNPSPAFFKALPHSVSERVRGSYEITERMERGNLTWTSCTIAAQNGFAINPGLYLNKYCPDPGQTKEEKRLLYLKAWAKASCDTSAAAALLARRKESLPLLGQRCLTFNGDVVWRMVAGLGNPNPLEAGFSLHPQYGIPWLYGSALKGIARSFRLRQIGEEVGVYPLAYDAWKSRKEIKFPAPTPLELLEAVLLGDGESDDLEKCYSKLQEDKAVAAWAAQAQPSKPLPGVKLDGLTHQFGRTYRAVFGSTSEIGRVTFLDAIPLNWRYKVDVMTPHYGDYYEGKAPPADWLTPSPVTFVTLDEGSSFRFDVVGSKEANVQNASDWLKGAVTTLGVGGKTRGGYGEMAVKAEPRQ